MTTNAQAALMAAAAMYANGTGSERTALDFALAGKLWLDAQDAADREARSKVIPKRDLDTVNKAFGKTPKPDNVLVLLPGQLTPDALQMVDTPKDVQFVSYEHALAQGWVLERG